MDLKHIEEIAYQQMGNRKEPKSREPGWLYYHGLRTAKIAQQLCQVIHFDGDIETIYTGALFHDIGKGSEPHNVRGAELVRTLFVNECDAGQLNTISKIIELHNQRQDSEKHPMFARVVQDADLLDHVGPIAIWLSFYWSGTHNETMHDHVKFVLGEENKGFIVGMRKRLNFDASRDMFDKRTQWADEFLMAIREVYFSGVCKNEV